MAEPGAADDRVLLVKTSSLGDVVHLLPALTEAAAQRPRLRFDWVVEAPYAELAALHGAVDRVIPVALRSWRRALGERATWRAWRDARRSLGARRYAAVVDAQGLIKSAVLARQARGPRWGFDAHSAREPPAAWGLDHGCPVPRAQHAIDRLRQLLGAALGYRPGLELPAAGLRLPELASTRAPTLALLHGTAWTSKHWPEGYWQTLARQASARGLQVLLPAADDAERARARRIAAVAPDAQVLAPASLPELAQRLRGCAGAIGVDSGLTHLAALLGTPTVGLFGPTDVARTGLRGPRTCSLTGALPCVPCGRRHCIESGPLRSCAGVVVEPPCFLAVTPARALAALDALMAGSTVESPR